MIWAFGRALRRAKSLRVVHLSGNPGLSLEDKTKVLVKYLVERSHAILVDSHNQIDFNKLPSNLAINGGCHGQENESCHSHDEQTKNSTRSGGNSKTETQKTMGKTLSKTSA